MRIDFTKMHGVGNDFIVFDAPADRAILEPERLRALADRRSGIGFDQALVLNSPRRADSALFYRIFNADGDEVEQCGNGARCIAALLHHRGLTRNGAVTLDSPAGLIHARIGGDARVSVNMGIPNFEPRSLPFEADGAADSYPLEVGGRVLEVGVVSVGNPHAVLTVDSVENAPVATLGPLLESHPRFPKRVNVGFLETRGARCGAPAGLRARCRRDPQLRHRRVRGGRRGTPPWSARPGSARRRARRRVAGKLGWNRGADLAERSD